jgi:hypothetical protein
VFEQLSNPIEAMTMLFSSRLWDSLMRTSPSSVLCTVCLLIGVSPLFSETIPKDKWQKFSSEVAGFSILMPGDPAESILLNQMNAFYTDGVKSYEAHVSLDAGSFSAGELIYPQPIDTPSDLSANLDRFQSFAAKNAHGRVVNQEDVSVQGMPGRRISLAFEINGTVYTMDQMLLLKENRLFRLIVMHRSARFDTEDIDRFFNSFSVTGPAKEWKRSRADPNEVVDKSEPEPAPVTTGVTSLECPAYPPSAREAHVGGMVRIQVTTNGKKVTDLKLVGGAAPDLAQAAEQNVRTWKFAENAPTKFTVTYWYVLEGEYEPDPVFNCRAKLELPDKVEVSANW